MVKIIQILLLVKIYLLCSIFILKLVQVCLQNFQAEIGKFYLSSTGSVLFNDGAANAVVNVDIAPASFLFFNSTFTVVLISSSLVENNGKFFVHNFLILMFVVCM